MTTPTEILEAIKELSLDNEVLGLRANNSYFGCDIVTVGRGMVARRSTSHLLYSYLSIVGTSRVQCRIANLKRE
jgi:hypothetical protein